MGYSTEKHGAKWGKKMNITFPSGSLFLAAKQLNRRPAKHRFHSIGSRAPEKLRFLAFAMSDRRWKDISTGKRQEVASNYGFLRADSQEIHYDPYDFRDGWQKEWDAPLNEGESVAERILEKILVQKPAGLCFDGDGFVSIRDLIRFMNHLPDGAVNPFTLDRLVWRMSPRKFAYKSQKQSIGLARPCDIVTIPKDESCPPPDVLYHATLPTNVRYLDSEGIQPIDGSFVSLAETAAEAQSYSPMHMDAFVYRVDAKKMNADGLLFRNAGAHGWQTDSVPLQYLSYF